MEIKVEIVMEIMICNVIEITLKVKYNIIEIML